MPHKTRGNGQLRPLRTRMSKHNKDKRGIKIEARKTVAQTLLVQNFQTRQMLLQFANLGFFRRLGWVLFGAKALQGPTQVRQSVPTKQVTVSKVEDTPAS